MSTTTMSKENTAKIFSYVVPPYCDTSLFPLLLWPKHRSKTMKNFSVVLAWISPLLSLSFSMSLRFLVLFCMLIKENFSNHFDRTVSRLPRQSVFEWEKEGGNDWPQASLIDYNDRRIFNGDFPRNFSIRLPRRTIPRWLDEEFAFIDYWYFVFHRISFRLDRWIFHERWSIFFSSHINTDRPSLDQINFTNVQFLAPSRQRDEPNETEDAELSGKMPTVKCHFSLSKDHRELRQSFSR